MEESIYRPPVLLDEETIARRVEELARQLDAKFDSQISSPPLFLGVLTGGWIFLADLVRRMNLPVECDFIRVSSYGDGDMSSGRVELLIPPVLELEGRHVVVVEDLVDTGHSMSAMRDQLSLRNPLSLTFVVLLDKPSRRKVEEKADLVGFEIPDRFVVGYGMDFAQKYRQLPYVGYLPDGT